MSKITLIKEPGIIREGIVKVLQKNLPKHIINASSITKHEFLLENDETDMLIIDLDTDVDTIKLVEFYSKQNIDIVVWTSDIKSDHLLELFKMGLHGYFYNGMDTSELIFAIEYVLNGKQFIHPHLSSILLKEYIKNDGEKIKRPTGVLTKREWEILELIVRGKNNEKIAANLFISITTVNNHVGSIYRKLHVTDRTNAALLAIKNNWCAF